MKLYLQLKPNLEALAFVRTVQKQLSQTPMIRLVNQRQLHLTVLHIGAVDKLKQSMAAHRSISATLADAELPKLILNLKALASEYALKLVTLQPTGYNHFGTNGLTFVMTFSSNPELQQLHSQGLTALKNFFKACNIADVETFMAADENLKYALSLRPHLTIAKSFDGETGTPVAQFPMSFQMMPVVYDV